MAAEDSRRWSRLQPPGTSVSRYPSSWGNVIYLARDTVHFAKDSREERTLSTTDGADNSGQTTLLDGHVNVVDKSLWFLSVLISGWSGSIVFLCPFKRSI